MGGRRRRLLGSLCDSHTPRNHNNCSARGCAAEEIPRRPSHRSSKHIPRDSYRLPLLPSALSRQRLHSNEGGVPLHCDRSPLSRRLLLLDEPFGALDPQVRKSLRQGLRDIIDRIGITAIFVTHDQARSLGQASPRCTQSCPHRTRGFPCFSMPTLPGSLGFRV